MQNETPVYERIVLKLSGEAMQERGARDNISLSVVRDIAERDRRRKYLARSFCVIPGNGPHHG
jgi:uridylate kinase